MKNDLETKRLELRNLTVDAALFMYELLNTAEWKKFIGDRAVENTDDAEKYIQKIIENPTVKYWVVRVKNENTLIGVVTFIKRDYLENHDIGFAFLPQYAKKGYAYEAAKAVLDEISKIPAHKTVLATTKAENINSIRLLEKLGLTYRKNIAVAAEQLLLFSTQ